MPSPSQSTWSIAKVFFQLNVMANIQDKEIYQDNVQTKIQHKKVSQVNVKVKIQDNKAQVKQCQGKDSGQGSGTKNNVKAKIQDT